MGILIEQISWVPALVEGADKTTRLRFKFMESEKVNVNKRRYPAAVLSHAVSEAQKKLDQGQSIYGSLGHLKELNVSDISHRLLSLHMNGHDAVAEAAVLQTSKGKDLLAVISAGGQIGVSARGTGNVIAEGGVDIVQNDYSLHGIDIVVNPSFDAHISAANIFESADFSGVKDSRPLFEIYREAQAAGFKGSLTEWEKRANPAAMNDKELLRSYHEARAAGFVGSCREYLAMRGGDK